MGVADVVDLMGHHEGCMSPSLRALHETANRRLYAEIEWLRAEMRALESNLLQLSQRCIALEAESRILPMKLSPITALQDATAAEWVELLTGEAKASTFIRSSM